MSNIPNVVDTINIIESENMIINKQEFEVKYEGKYVDFYPFKLRVNKIIPITRYDNIPDNVFGKIIIDDKSNKFITKTTIYKSFNKKYVRVKK